jgi:hypothetical protein
MPPSCCAIFVEGLPGSGKSTLAQRLAIDLERSGRPARWLYEEARPHPLDGYFDPAHHSSPDAFMAAARERWRAFGALAARDLTIIESHLFQGPIGSLLLHDVEGATILAFVAGLMSAVEPRAPRLIRFRELDQESAVRRINDFRWGSVSASPYVRRLDGSRFAASRGIRGGAGLLAFYQEFSALADRLTERCAWPALIIDDDARVGVDYAVRLQRIRRFLDLDAPTTPPRIDPSRYVGVYAVDDIGSSTFTIAGEADGLVIRGCPVLWQAGNRLLPAGGDRFHVVSWPMEAIFTIAPDGRAGAMRLVARDPGWTRPDRVFARVTDQA